MRHQQSRRGAPSPSLPPPPLTVVGVNLVGTADDVEVVLLTKLLHEVRTKRVRNASVVLAPPAPPAPRYNAHCTIRHNFGCAPRTPSRSQPSPS